LGAAITALKSGLYLFKATAAAAVIFSAPPKENDENINKTFFLFINYKTLLTRETYSFEVALKNVSAYSIFLPLTTAQNCAIDEHILT
jgi:hypothetical protein